MNAQLNSVQMIFIGLFALLTLSSVITALKARLQPERNFTELKLRVRSWWLIVILFAVAMLSTIKISMIFFAFIAFLSFKEYLSLIPMRRADRRVLFWAYLSIPIQFYWIYTGWYGMFIIFIPVYVFLFLPFRALLIGEMSGFLTSISMIQWGLMVGVFSIGHLASLMKIAGAELVVFLVLLTSLNDVAQYIWGKTFGRHKIIPKVSPNKTVEGFLGGLLTTTCLAYFVAPILTPLSTVHSLLVGAMISAVGFIGDVTISAVKRDMGIKDSGTLIPGHGGILDRVDSLTYTAPLFFHFMRYFYY